MTPEQKIADAIRQVALRLEDALLGRRSRRISADDLLETLLSIADRLDPPATSTEIPLEDLPY